MRKKEPLTLSKGKTPAVTPQTDKLPHIYLSHTVVHTRELEEELLRKSGLRYRCFSFVYLHPDGIYSSERAREAYRVNLEHGNHIMMDSGAFSFHMFVVKRQEQKMQNTMELVNRTIKQYVEFCGREKKNWDWYVTFDYKQDQQIIRRVTKYFESKGLRPAPVFHGESSTDNLKRWLDEGYKRIGISTLPSRKKDHRKTQYYLDQVFRVVEPYEGVKLHGFAVTSLSYVWAWPWYSVDSSSWSRAASLGAIYALDPARGSLASIHLSQTGGLKQDTKTLEHLAPEAQKAVRDQVEERGWDFDLLRRSLAYRFIYNAWVFAHLEQFKEQAKGAHVRWQSLIA